MQIGHLQLLILVSMQCARRPDPSPSTTRAIRPASAPAVMTPTAPECRQHAPASQAMPSSRCWPAARPSPAAWMPCASATRQAAATLMQSNIETAMFDPVKRRYGAARRRGVRLQTAKICCTTAPRHWFRASTLVELRLAAEVLLPHQCPGGSVESAAQPSHGLRTCCASARS